MVPRYPDIRVRLHSHNPFALVSAVRQAMRRSRVEGHEIERFTEEALREDEPRRMKAVCAEWTAVEIA